MSSDRPSEQASALDDVVMIGGELRRAGAAVLADAARRTEHLLVEAAGADEPLPVSTELTHGSVVGSLDSLSAHACLLVLQHEGMGPSGETSTLSVTAGVVTRAQCPVAAVPSDWRPPTAAPVGIVTVGIDVHAPSSRLVEVALHEAARRGARLRVVHARQPGIEAGSSTMGRIEVARSCLSDLVAEARLTAPRVEVELAVETGEPGEVLRAESGCCDLVVVGRHHRRHVVGARIGSTVRELLRWSEVPVVVVDPVSGDLTGQRPRLTSGASG